MACNACVRKRGCVECAWARVCMFVCVCVGVRVVACVCAHCGLSCLPLGTVQAIHYWCYLASTSGECGVLLLLGYVREREGT